MRCSKIRYPDRDSAFKALIHCFHRFTDRRKEDHEYRCPRCGGWHLTSNHRHGNGFPLHHRSQHG